MSKRSCRRRGQARENDILLWACIFLNRPEFFDFPVPGPGWTLGPLFHSIRRDQSSFWAFHNRLNAEERKGFRLKMIAEVFDKL